VLTRACRSLAGIFVAGNVLSDTGLWESGNAPCIDSSGAPASYTHQPAAATGCGYLDLHAPPPSEQPGCFKTLSGQLRGARRAALCEHRRALPALPRPRTLATCWPSPSCTW